LLVSFHIKLTYLLVLSTLKTAFQFEDYNRTNNTMLRMESYW